MKGRSSPAERGREMEQLACRHLEARGLRLRQRNFRCRSGEIDLVMEESDGTVVFVEVRYRGSARFGGAAESIDARKRARLLSAARHYLQHDGERPCRIDVIAIAPAGGDYSVQWLQNAIEWSD